MALPTDERLDILQSVSSSWLELVKTIRKLSDAEIVKPGTVDEWSVKRHHGAYHVLGRAIDPSHRIARAG